MSTFYTHEMIAQKIDQCLTFEITKTTVPTMRGQQKHIIQQDRDGTYQQRTRNEWRITNITFCGIPLNEWSDEMAAESAQHWIPACRYYGMAWATKKEALAELGEDIVDYNATQILGLLNCTQTWDHNRVLGKQVIDDMHLHMHERFRATQ
jgi:hypothetical protein